jgi:hypothetical protein
MKFLFLLPLCTLAQTLPPGTFRDLKLDKPLVLDTGSLYVYRTWK